MPLAGKSNRSPLGNAGSRKAVSNVHSAGSQMLSQLSSVFSTSAIVDSNHSNTVVLSHNSTIANRRCKEKKNCNSTEESDVDSAITLRKTWERGNSITKTSQIALGGSLATKKEYSRQVAAPQTSKLLNHAKTEPGPRRRPKLKNTSLSQQSNEYDNDVFMDPDDVPINLKHLLEAYPDIRAAKAQAVTNINKWCSKRQHVIEFETVPPKKSVKLVENKRKSPNDDISEQHINRQNKSLNEKTGESKRKKYARKKILNANGELESEASESENDVELPNRKSERVRRQIKGFPGEPLRAGGNSRDLKVEQASCLVNCTDGKEILELVSQLYMEQQLEERRTNRNLSLKQYISINKTKKGKKIKKDDAIFDDVIFILRRAQKERSDKLSCGKLYCRDISFGIEENKIPAFSEKEIPKSMKKALKDVRYRKENGIKDQYLDTYRRIEDRVCKPNGNENTDPKSASRRTSPRLNSLPFPSFTRSPYSTRSSPSSNRSSPSSIKSSSSATKPFVSKPVTEEDIEKDETLLKVKCNCKGLCDIECCCVRRMIIHGKAFIFHGFLVRAPKTDTWTTFLQLCGDLCSCRGNCPFGIKGIENYSNVQLQCRDVKMGWGVVAGEAIPQGKVLFPFVGQVLRKQDMKEDSVYSFVVSKKNDDVGTRQMLSACNQKPMTTEAVFVEPTKQGNFARYINHSTYPNLVPIRVFVNTPAVEATRFFFYAARNIAKGEELFTDYGEEYVNKHLNGMCLCCNELCTFNPTLKGHSKEKIENILEQMERHAIEDSGVATFLDRLKLSDLRQVEIFGQALRAVMLRGTYDNQKSFVEKKFFSKEYQLDTSTKFMCSPKDLSYIVVKQAEHDAKVKTAKDSNQNNSQKKSE